MVLRVHGMDEAGVRFSVGPPGETCSELRKWSDFAEAKIAEALDVLMEDLI